jgi:nucleoside 2-deoxyribosyltransferase
MKIMICGSMTFAKEMLETKKKLEDLGHEVYVPLDTESHINNPKLIDDLVSDYKHAQKNNILKQCFDLIAKSDAILVLNYAKNGIKGYIGTSSLMEIGLAYYLGKRIFILKKLPKSSQYRWVHEVEIMRPVIINGEMHRIDNYTI